MKKEKKETPEQKQPKQTLQKEYSGMSLEDIYHFENIKLTNPERRNQK